MKLSITQMVLGILIVILACIVAYWMIFGIRELFSDQYYNSSHVLVQNYTPQNEAAFAISRGASVLLVLLGLGVVISGALWWKVENKVYLAKAQIIAGSLIVVLAAFIALWGVTFNYLITIEGGPVLTIPVMKTWTIFITMFGLAVLVLGIMQWAIAKNKVIAKSVPAERIDK
jgi:hypothetical protein